MRFRFSLQRILELRQRREQAAATELEAARAAAERAHARVEELEARRAQGAAARNARGITVGELRNAGYLLEQLDHHVVQARSAAAQADAGVSTRLEEFQVACRERQVLDRLREKHLEEWHAQEVQQDRQLMDTIGLSRFTRATGNAPNTEER
jgi:flagellar FliJ protein